jgi:hypothetical protein
VGFTPAVVAPDLPGVASLPLLSEDWVRNMLTDLRSFLGVAYCVCRFSATFEGVAVCHAATLGMAFFLITGGSVTLGCVSAIAVALEVLLRSFFSAFARLDGRRRI